MSHRTIVIGAGQAGLAAAYLLARRGLDYTVLEAQDRVGGSWHHRWDSLRLFTPATEDGLPGLPFPRRDRFPTAAAMAHYLADYARTFDLEVRTATAVDGLFREDGRYTVTAGARSFAADSVILATGSDRVPRVPGPAAELDPAIRQLHSGDYRNPGQVAEGPVAVVGAGNSGAEIALELSATHDVVLAGNYPPAVPFRYDGAVSHVVFPLVTFLGTRVLTRRTPVGRRLRSYALAGHSGPLVPVRPADLAAAGVRRAGRVTTAVGGRPATADGQVLDVATVLWATGFDRGLDWLDLPGLDGSRWLPTEGGAVTGQEGLYVLGQLFQHAIFSHTVLGVARDARRVVRDVARRANRRGRLRVPAGQR